ncbi:MAG: hypothetical protein IT182_10285 [Acidobacteria bacterium]|nr:hypothetical protein [Acidobacteriota bacterium]
MRADMPQDDVLATMEGIGSIVLPDPETPVEVGYRITLVAQRPGQPEPPGGGAFHTRVLLSARVADLFHWFAEHREGLILEIADGRRLPIVVTSPDGDAIGLDMLA